MKNLLQSKFPQLTKDIKASIPEVTKPVIQPSRKRLLSESEAARIIAKAWQKKKAKEAILDAPLEAYRSMINTTEEQRQLSSLMFGYRVAYLLHTTQEQTPNPWIGKEYYHRSSPLDSPLLDAFLQEYGVPHFDKEQYSYIPISLLKSNPIESVLPLFKDKIPSLQYIKKSTYTIAVLIIPKPDTEDTLKLKNKIKNMGLSASAWEIAENIRESVLQFPETEKIAINLNEQLPKTKEELLRSESVGALRTIIIFGKKYPTSLLALCLKKLINDLPPNISPEAIQRIATLLDFTNTFYSRHYPRYAFCVYAIIHEISLALVQNKDPLYLEKEYNLFKEESQSTLSTALGLDATKLKHSEFIASASTSGASACAVAMRIASTMRIDGGKKPKVKIFKPCYYELPNTFNLESVEDASSADVLMISVGPIVNPEGLTPGVDINAFIKRHLIDTHRTKPITLIVDATTALYSNLHLNEEVRQLITKGILSVIVHESHQKFGLIHSDQAQYGRVFGWCSTNHFVPKIFQRVEKNSKEDFFNHADIRIGAFVSTRCKETLEEIKKQHFANGALLRAMLTTNSIVSKDIAPHQDMQTNTDELYFLTAPEVKPNSYTSVMEWAAYGAIERRDSFGHYRATVAGIYAGGSTHQRRLSPDASDSVDNLIFASHIRIAHQCGYSAKKMLQVIVDAARKKEDLSLDQQILLAGMLHSITSFLPIMPHSFAKVEYSEHFVTADDQKRIMAAKQDAKSIVFCAADLKFYLGFHSHGKQFRTIEVKDPYILSLLQSGSITQPEHVPAIKAYVDSLQKAYLAEECSLLTAYETVKNALTSCSLLKNRPSIMDINAWLAIVEHKILDQYQPQKPQQFLKAVHSLYKNGALNSQHLDTFLIFINNTQLAEKELCYDAFKNEAFIKAIQKVFEGNKQILARLEDTSEKYKLASIQSKQYLSNCFEALHHFYSTATPNAAQRAQLIDSIRQAEKSYIEILAIDRNSFSQCARYILKAVTNFIETLCSFFGCTYSFFSGTTSERQLKQLDRELVEEIESPLAP